MSQVTAPVVTLEDIEEAVATIRTRAGGRAPTVGLILGSGLGSFAERLEDAVALEYGEIHGFPVSGVEGHAGRLVLGKVGGVACVAMQGRVHYYEGHALDRVTFPVRVLARLGVTTFVITNAAGGIMDGLVPGDLVLLADHLNLFGATPLRGGNDDRLGPRFPDLTEAYAKDLRALARREGEALGLTLREGVYAGLSGPAYETPAEVRMLRGLGADLCGMSTVPETIVARHMGARVLGISCVTNLAAGLSGEPLSHVEVTETATRVRATFAALLERIITALGREPAVPQAQPKGTP